MRKSSRQFVFQHVYEMAALVEESIEDEGSLIELDWENPELLRGVAKFSKISILHLYIYSMIAVDHRRDYRKHADMYDAEDVDDIERLFDAYSVKYLSYATYISSIPIEEARGGEEVPFYNWFLTQERSFEELWEKLTDETFHLLFGNRSFLLKFNRAVARYFEQGTIHIPAEYLGSEGKIRRQPIPIWVRDAVYFRDRGRCILCQVDLSGLLSTDRSDHLDHMVPLAAWGINDPCNIQLLCEACNLKKAAGEPTTGSRYAPWWS